MLQRAAISPPTTIPSAWVTDRPETRLGPPIPNSPSPIQPHTLPRLASHRAALRSLPQLQLATAQLLYHPRRRAIPTPSHNLYRRSHTRDARLNPTAPYPPPCSPSPPSRSSASGSSLPRTARAQPPPLTLPKSRRTSRVSGERLRDLVWGREGGVGRRRKVGEGGYARGP